MPGTSRRNKPLKAKTVLADISEFTLANPANGDLLVFNSSDSVWKNQKTLTGDYTISGLLAVTTLTSSGLVALSNDLTVAIDFTVAGNTSLQGTAIIGGAATLSSTLAVTGAVTLSGALTVTGTLSGAGFSFSGNGTVTGTLGVTGVLSAATFTATEVTTTGDVNVGTQLLVTGTAIFEDDVSFNANIVAGAIAATSLSTSGNLSTNAILADGSLTFGGFGVLSHDATDITLHNPVTSGWTKFTGIQTDGSTTHTLLTLDPDALAELYHNNVATAKTDSLANGGFLVNNTVTGAGYERVLTTADISVAIASGTVTDAMLTWSGSAWTEIAQVTMSWTSGVLTVKVLDDAAALVTGMTIDGDGSFTAFFNDTRSLATVVNGVRIYDETGDDPNLTLSSQADVDLAKMFSFDGSFAIRNLVTSGTFLMTAKDSASADHNVFLGDPNGATTLYYDGVRTFASAVNGTQLYDGSGDDPNLVWMTQAGVELCKIFHFSNDMTIRNQVDSGHVVLVARNAASANVNCLIADGDAGVILNYTGTKEFETKSGGVIVDDELEVNGAFNHDGSTYGVYGTTPISQQTGVAVTIAALHAAVVALGFITA